MMQLNFLFWHGIKPPMKYCNLNDPLLTTGSGIRYGIRNDVDNDLTMSSARKRHRTAGYREKKVYNHVLEQKYEVINRKSEW